MRIEIITSKNFLEIKIDLQINSLSFFSALAFNDCFCAQLNNERMERFYEDFLLLSADFDFQSGTSLCVENFGV